MIDAKRLRRAAGYLVLGLVLYVAFLLANAPAVWLAEAATRFTNGIVSLANPQGTLWHGRADLYAGGRALGQRHLGTLQWRVNPLWLLLGRAQLDLDLDGADARAHGTIRTGLRRLNASELLISAPAHLVAIVYPAAVFFAPTGTIELRAPNLELSHNGLVTDADVRWQGAGGRFTGAAPLGDYHIEVHGQGETAKIRVSTLSGRLTLNGEGEWRVTGDGDFRFVGNAVPNGDPQQLEPLLRQLGRDLGGGRRELRFNIQLPIVREMGY